MDEATKASLQQLLEQWIQDRHKALQEVVMATWEEGLGRFRPDSKLMETLAEMVQPPIPEKPELPFTDLPSDTEFDLGTGLDLLEAATSQGEVLKRLLEAIQPFTERSSLFVVKQGIATLYATRGYESDAPRLGAPVVPPPDLEDLIAGRRDLIDEVGPSYAALLAPLSRFEAADVKVYPLKLRRKVVALLMVDSGLRQVIDHPNHVRALVHTAEASLSSLAVQREDEKAPKPAASGPAPTAEAPQAHAMQTMQIRDPLAEAEPVSLDPKVRTNAERSARVMMSDIEQYFPQKIQQGIAQRNIYAFLRDELDRSRASFVERYGLDIETKHRIFYQTVIQHLCHGDAGVLGQVPWAPKD